MALYYFAVAAGLIAGEGRDCSFSAVLREARCWQVSTEPWLDALGLRITDNFVLLKFC
jgi:hypothetical protein